MYVSPNVFFAFFFTVLNGCVTYCWI